MENTKKRKYRIFGNVWGNFLDTAADIYIFGLCVYMYKINDTKYLLLPQRHTCNSDMILRSNTKYFDNESAMISFVERYIDDRSDAKQLLNLLNSLGVE